jgi:uncharacterized NAD(P)/FAD-binding protein YdhS
MHSIVIIGGGFSGTLTAIQLSRLADSDLQIFLVNTKYPVAKGIAYSTSLDVHLLNVRASRMSAFHDEPNHFVKWLQTQKAFSNIDIEELKLQFIPRKTYGNYLSELLKNEIKARNRIKIIEDEVIDLVKDDDQHIIVLRNHFPLMADKIVLATGNHLPGYPFPYKSDFIHSHFYIHDPWQTNLFPENSPKENVLLVGSGLTMVDIFLTACKANFKGKLIVVSRNGLLPAPHSLPGKFLFDEGFKNKDLDQLYFIVKRNLHRAFTGDGSFDEALDVIRKNIHSLWKNFSFDDQKIFLRHLRSYWNIVRHRIPESIHTELMSAVKKGTVEIISGRITETNYEKEKALITIQTKKREEKRLVVSKVINCTGPQLDFSKIQNPFISNLIHRKLVALHPLRLGIRADEEFKVIQPNGRASEYLFVIGSALTGELWESIAINELRQQAQQIAITILRETHNMRAANTTGVGALR